MYESKMLIYNYIIGFSINKNQSCNAAGWSFVCNSVISVNMRLRFYIDCYEIICYSSLILTSFLLVSEYPISINERGVAMGELSKGNSMESLFLLSNNKSKRVSSYDKTGGNMDSIFIQPHEKTVFAEIGGCGIVRHIWCTLSSMLEDRVPAKHPLRRVVLRMFWDGEETPSVEAPLGDFFGMGHGITRNFTSAAFAMSPQDGRGMTSYFPMPFHKSARFELENQSDSLLQFFFYVDYEEVRELPPNTGYFHAHFRREANTNGWAETISGLVFKDKGSLPEYPDWFPSVWAKPNTTGEDNYVILETYGKGKYVGCNLNIDVFERQANDWYGEGDDMIFVDGEPWPPNLHGTGTEDYFNTAFCPQQEFCAPYHGITLYSGDQAGFPWGGKNSMYRLHILDPIHFEKSIKVTIEHGHANKLSNDYSSTAYWYQLEPHSKQEPLNDPKDRIPR